MESNFFADFVATFSEKIEDPNLWLLFVGPVSGIGLILLAIIFFKTRNKVQLPDLESLKIPEQTKDADPSVPQAEKLDQQQTDPSPKVTELSWFARLTQSLSSTRNQLVGNISLLFSGGGKLDAALREKALETLIRADLGLRTSQRLVDSLAKHLGDAEANWQSVREAMLIEITKILEPSRIQSEAIPPEQSPKVILVVGVNGVGKTTSVAKLASRNIEQGKKVLLAAADTFRAAAIDQLKLWGERIGVEVIAQSPGSDPAAVAFDSVKAAKARGIDTLIIDTAGRLHNKKELMDELSKIRRVIAKEIPSAPHEVWIVIDATTGQNAITQIRAFSEATTLTGIVVTKLDGTAKGGIVLAASDLFALPIRYIGIGEKAEDLKEFDAAEFAKALFI